MKQGKFFTGIIAAGFTASKNHPMDRWRQEEKVGSGPSQRVAITVLDPGKDKLLDINDLPKQYWASRASGVGLPTEVFREIKKRWTALLGENADELKNARKAITLDDDDADDDYKISNKDTRAAVIKQIEERQGQGKFRQKMIDNYGGMCAVVGVARDGRTGSSPHQILSRRERSQSAKRNATSCRPSYLV